MKTPYKNPPIWAKKAIPPWDLTPREKIPDANCRKNQKAKNKKAGTGTISQKNQKGIKVKTLARGKNTKYMPRTPAIAPDAPIIGIFEEKEKIP